MCLIMTEDGWQQLGNGRVCSNHNTPPERAYVGLFPSADLCSFYNSQKERMKYFDDGNRMVYGKPDITVPTANAEPIHPIPYPPKGFMTRSVEKL
jgi:hypothetical protein